MSQANKLFGINLSFNVAGNVTAAAAVTVTNTAAVNLSVKGESKQLALGAKTPAYIGENGAALTASELALAALAIGEGRVVVWATDGTNVKGIFGPKVNIGRDGKPTPGLAFPNVPDEYTAYAFYTVQANSAPFVFGTTNYSGVAGTTVTPFSVVTLPAKSMGSFIAI